LANLFELQKSVANVQGNIIACAA